METLSLYLHIPFCTTKCSYCAFNTYVQLDDLIPEFVDSLCHEIRIAGADNPYPRVETIFFGGGTPSLLTADQFLRIIDTIHRYFPVSADAEISIEANPNDLSVTYLRSLRQAGINRLSIGVQSANNNELVAFERRHDSIQARQSFEDARRAGFDNINLDLMYGFPGQSMDSWRQSLKMVVELKPEHLSLYALGLEEGTRLLHDVQIGNRIMPEDDLIADMYEVASDLLAWHGYEQYEISNWSRPGKTCRHNLQYWRNEAYLGLGPGAHGYASGLRYDTVLAPKQYIALLKNAESGYVFPRTPATRNIAHIDDHEAIIETLITQLRLLGEGVSRAWFVERFGRDLLDIHGEPLKRFADYGLLEITPERVMITKAGRLLSNLIFRELV